MEYYIKFIKDNEVHKGVEGYCYLTYKKGQVLKVGRKLSDQLLSLKVDDKNIVKKATEKEFSDYTASVLKQRNEERKAKNDLYLKELNKKNTCKDCEGSEKPCEDCEKAK